MTGYHHVERFPSCQLQAGMQRTKTILCLSTYPLPLSATAVAQMYEHRLLCSVSLVP